MYTPERNYLPLGDLLIINSISVKISGVSKRTVKTLDRDLGSPISDLRISDLLISDLGSASLSLSLSL